MKIDGHNKIYIIIQHYNLKKKMYWFTASDFINLSHDDYKDESMCIVLNNEKQLDLIYNILNCYYQGNDRISIL